MKKTNGRLQNSQKLRRSKGPTVPQQHVVLLLDADPGEAAEHVHLVGHLLKLHQLHFPRSMLLSSNGLQRNGSVAVASSSIVKEHLNLLHRAVI